MLHGASLQNPTEWRRDSPFFGSDFGRFLLEGHRSTAMGTMKLREVSFDSGSENENIDISDFRHTSQFRPMQTVARKTGNCFG
jgi:hypothetical protein